LAEYLKLIGTTITGFTGLEDHGPIIVIEPGDNPRGLALAGLPSGIGGIFGVIPEHVEQVLLECNYFWSVLVVLTNGYAPTYWIPVGMDEEVDRHLTKYLDSDKPPRKPTLQTEEERQKGLSPLSLKTKYLLNRHCPGGWSATSV